MRAPANVCWPDRPSQACYCPPPPAGVSRGGEHPQTPGAPSTPPFAGIRSKRTRVMMHIALCQSPEGEEMRVEERRSRGTGPGHGLGAFTSRPCLR